MIAASVDDLPEPVGPVTSTIPLRRFAIFPNSEGKFSASKSGAFPGITRITTAQVPRCMKTLTRNRLEPGRLYETSHDPDCFKLSMACWFLPIKSAAMRRVSSLVRARAVPAGASLPLISTSGGLPGEKKRSLILAEVLSIDAKSSGVEIGAVAGAAAAAARATGAAAAAGATFSGRLAGEDIEKS